MRTARKLHLVLVLAILAGLAGAAEAKAPSPEQFVGTLFRQFAFRDPSVQETTYWAERVIGMTPEAAEKRLRNWFFVHAVYKTSLDRTVTIAEVSHLVDLLDRDQITFEAIQWSIFSSDEYKRVKAEGRAGKFFMKYEPTAKPL